MESKLSEKVIVALISAHQHVFVTFKPNCMVPLLDDDIYDIPEENVDLQVNHIHAAEISTLNLPQQAGDALFANGDTISWAETLESSSVLCMT
jgi:hypothetical protein